MKIILIAIMLVVMIALVGSFVVANSANGNSTTNSIIDTQIDIQIGTPLHSGDHIEFTLKDINGKGIAKQNVTVFIKDGNGNDHTDKILTNENGKGMMVLNGESGDHEITIAYVGNGQYNGCVAKEIVKIVEHANKTEKNATKVAESTHQDNKTQKVNNTHANTVHEVSPSQAKKLTNATGKKIFYDSKLNEYFDSNGIIIFGQNVGYSIDYIRNHAPIITPDGSLM